jgi:hypothetical protein
MRGTRRRSVRYTVKEKLVKILGIKKFVNVEKWLRRGVAKKSRRGHIHVNVGKGVRHGDSTEKVSQKAHSKKGTSKMTFALRRRTAMLRAEDVGVVGKDWAIES